MYRIDDYRAGAHVRERETVYRENDQRIQNTILRFDEMPRLEFLRSIAHNIRLD